MANEKTYKGLKSALEALKYLSPAEQKKLLAQLSVKDPELVRQLQNNLFEFADIACLAKADFKYVWFEIPHNVWHLALRGASDSVLLFIRSCVTERAFNQLLEDLKDLGPQPMSKVTEAQKKIIDEIQKMSQQGRLHIPNKVGTIK